MEDLSLQQVLDIRVAAGNMSEAIARIVQDRDELRFAALCDQCLVHGLEPFLIGGIRAYYGKDAESFDWLMYGLSRVEGYENILAQFWVENWRIRLNGHPNIGVFFD